MSSVTKQAYDKLEAAILEATKEGTLLGLDIAVSSMKEAQAGTPIEMQTWDKAFEFLHALKEHVSTSDWGV